MPESTAGVDCYLYGHLRVLLLSYLGTFRHNLLPHLPIAVRLTFPTSFALYNFCIYSVEGAATKLFGSTGNNLTPWPPYL